MDFAERYKTPLSAVFSREHKLVLEHRVELALLRALGTVGLIPTEAHAAIKAAVDNGSVTLQRTLDIEKETQHDIMAMIKALSEQSAQYGGFVHYGATSQDINDTVVALQLNAAKDTLLTATQAVRAQLTALSSRHARLVSIGRTHGQHAIPITMGFKFANFLFELSTAEHYLSRVSIPGKFGGAVGTYASLHTREVERLVMAELGLAAVPISTQVVSRLFIADFIFGCSAVCAVLERLGKEIRNLQRTEIAETMEGFGAGQVGSSTMPQKRNPHKSERICGLARDVRSALGPALETVSVEHERDLTNSSVERLILPRAAVITHYCLLEMDKILGVLQVDTAAVERNLLLLQGKQLSERVMLACAAKLGRQQAHEILRVHAALSGEQFAVALEQDERIASAMSREQLRDLLDPHTYIGLAPEIVQQIVERYGTEPAAKADANKTLTYAAAGVDIDSGDSLVERIKPAAASTARPGADAQIGGFGGLFDLAAVGCRDPILVAGTDGVGTKLQVAAVAERHDSIGIDLVAMCVNDVIVQGAEPLFFLDYYASAHLDVPIAAAVVSGIAAGCRSSGCALIGGETAELPSMYKPGDYDLAGFAVGVVEREHLLPRPDRMSAGDVVLGLASDGLHSNGFSLVRRVVADSGAQYSAPPPYPSSASRLCDDLLTPTRLYVRPLLTALRSSAEARDAILGMAHITGGGLLDNVDRVLPPHLTAHIDGAHGWPMPPVFRWLRGGQGVRAGSRIDDMEMLRVFNCGVGMAVVVRETEAAAASALLTKQGETVFRLGVLRQRQGEEKQVQIEDAAQLFR